ncbi:hypothetical protein [Ekhidna sp.]|uniref:hypothetical protein n=1 Tax=Ekhidna sp. TaxID=2608089 RepID=UPI003C7CFD8D
MAEEFDIQSVWKKSKERETVSDTSAYINTLERKGTRTTLYWIKTILWIEFWLSIVGLPFLIVYTTKRGDSTGLVISYVVLTFAYLFYYQFLIRKIRKFNYDGNVIQSLKKVYAYLRFYLLHYKVVIWLSMIFGLVYAIFGPENKEVFSKLETTTEWVIAIGITTLIIAVIGGVMHLLVHLIYGRKIKRLRKMVKDLESVE